MRSFAVEGENKKPRGGSLVFPVLHRLSAIIFFAFYLLLLFFFCSSFPNAHSLAYADDAGEAGAHISAMTVKSQSDGTAPWDDDNADGNDTDEKNLRVRTFDYINYTIEYTTALNNEWQNVDEANVRIEFTLPIDAKKASFNMEAMNWLLEPKTTYHYSDGTSSTTWDKKKTVVKQVLTGYRHVANTEDVNAIPGAGTLSVGIYVKGAMNGEKISPAFKAWVEGDPTVVESTPETVTVTAAPRYNISLKQNGSMSERVYVDKDKGVFQREEFEKAHNTCRCQDTASRCSCTIPALTKECAV